MQVVFELVERCGAAISLQDLWNAVERFSRQLSIEFWYCGENLDYVESYDLSNPRCPVALLNYPQAYIDRYNEAGHLLNDFINIAVRRKTDPFVWDDARMFVRTPAQRSVVSEAADAGLVKGYCVPIRAARSRTASFNIASREALNPDVFPAVNLAAPLVYEMLLRLWPHPRHREAVALPARERECLAWAAEGKSSAAIAEITGLSPDTVDEYIDRARRRYGVATRVQAIARAIVDGEITPQA